MRILWFRKSLTLTHFYINIFFSQHWIISSFMGLVFAILNGIEKRKRLESQVWTGTWTYIFKLFYFLYFKSVRKWNVPLKHVKHPHTRAFMPFALRLLSLSYKNVACIGLFSYGFRCKYWQIIRVKNEGKWNSRPFIK